MSWNNDQVHLERFNRRQYFTKDLAGTDHKLIWNMACQMNLKKAMLGSVAERHSLIARTCAHAEGALKKTRVIERTRWVK